MNIRNGLPTMTTGLFLARSAGIRRGKRGPGVRTRNRAFGRELSAPAVPPGGHPSRRRPSQGAEGGVRAKTLAAKAKGMAAAAACLAGAIVMLDGAPARAVTPGEVASAVQTAYDAYQKLFGHQLSLDDATNQIVNAISSAKTEIEAHIDQVTVADVQACARSAISDLADINAMNQVTLQAFARDATNCAERAVAQLGAVSSGAPVDELGFALNTIAPIALFARTDAGFTVDTLRSDVITGDQLVVSRLDPPCHATPLWGDAEPGGPVEVQLNCFGYNRTGFDYVDVRIKRGQPLPAFNYTQARDDAMQFTSYPIAQVALSTL